MSFADLGGAAEDEAALGLTRPGLWGPRGFIYLFTVCASECARCTAWRGGGGGRAGGRWEREPGSKRRVTCR